MQGIIELDNGKRYNCIFLVQKGEVAPRDSYGQKEYPDCPDYIDDLECTIRTPKGRVKVTSARIINRVYEKLMEVENG